MSHPTYTAQDWIPRDDMATLARCSVDTITRAAKKHQLETRVDDTGRVLVNVGDYLALGKLRTGDLAVGATPAESAEVLRARASLEALKIQVAELTGRLSLADATVETLREQLAVKDKQLGRQGDQISQLIGRLGIVGGAA